MLQLIRTYLTNSSDYCESSKIWITYCIVRLYTFLAIVLTAPMVNASRIIRICLYYCYAASRRKSPLISSEHRSTDYLPLYFLHNSTYRRCNAHMCSLIKHVYVITLSRFNEPNYMDAEKLSEFCRRKSRSPCTCLFSFFFFLM